MGGYFQNIKNGFQSVFEGMSVTLASMFVRPVTVQYPEVDISSNETISKGYKGTLMGMPENYRGVLDLDLSLCTSCGLCVKACPIDCIIIENEKCDKDKLADQAGEPILNRFTQKQAIKTRANTRFDINMGKCMFCGLCTIACPTKAIYHTNTFEMNRTSLEDLVLTFVTNEEKERVLARAEEIAKEAAEKKAAKAAKEKAAKEKEKKEGAKA
jgi:formate hydrogenlyase subunit 6/NADH:ubiquinone oxidoreductase subunit I